MPAANQIPLGALRISSTGVAQDAGGGGGDSTASILKSPFAARGTGLVLRSTKGATSSQMSVAKTWRLAAAPPVGVSTSAVPTVMRPSSFTSAFNSAMTHRWAGCTPRTMLRVTTFAVAAVPGAFETGSTPIPPSNLTTVSSARASDNTSASETTVTSVTIPMMYLLVSVRFAWTSSDGLDTMSIENHHLILVLCEFVTRILYAGTWWISSFTLVMGCCYKPIRVSCGVHEKSDNLTPVLDP